MSLEQGARNDQDVQQGSVWCPRCSHLLATTGDSAVTTCPSCGAGVDWAIATRRSQTWITLQEGLQQQREARQCVTVAEERLRDAKRDEAAASRAARAAQAAWDAQTQPLQTTIPAPSPYPDAQPAPSTPTPHLPSSQPVDWTTSAPRQRSGIPVAVLLQGTGAVLLLAALTAASAVLWETMPQAVQILVLLAAVALVGAVTVVARPLPATSVILAALTAASGVVVASSLPTIVPGLDEPWYPAAASAVGAATLLVAGRLSRVAIWWHGGWITFGLTGLLLAAATIAESSLESGTQQWYGLATILVAAAAVPLFIASAALAEAEDEAAATSWWTAAGIGVLAMLLAVGGVALWLTDLGTTTSDGRGWLAVSFVGLAALSYLVFATAWLTGRRSAPGYFVASVAFLAPLPALTLAVPEVDSTATALVAVAPMAAALAVLVVIGWRYRGNGWLATAALTAGLTLVVSSVLVNLAVTEQSTEPAFASLLASLTALAVALACWTYAALVDSRLWAGAGLLLGSVAWLGAVATGTFGGSVETVTLVVLAALLGSWWLGRGLDLWQLRSVGAAVPQYLIVAFLLPTLAASLAAVADGVTDGPRVALLAGGLVAVAALARWQRTGATLPAVAIASFGLLHVVAAVTDRVTDPIAEWYSLPTAAAVALVAAAGVVDRWATPRAGVVAVLVVGFVPSAAAVLADPGWDALTAARLALVMAAAGLTVLLAWRWAFVAWATATLGLATVLAVYLDWVLVSVRPPGDGGAPWEVASLPIALGVGVSVALAVRMLDPRRSLGAGVTAATIVAAVPTMVALGSDPLIEQSDTAARLLVLLTAAGLLAILLDAVAPIRSGIAATVLVLLPLWVYGGWLGEQPVVVLEAATAPLALAGALVLGWIRRPATASQWWSRAVAPAALVLLLTSTLWAIAVPLGEGAELTWIRTAVVVAAWLAAAAILRRRPKASALSASVGVLVVWANVLVVVSNTADPALEAYAWPSAVAVAAWCGLWAWATGLRHYSWLVAAPAVSLVVIPTAALAWADGTVGWRVWFALVVGGALVAVGAWREWAGFVYPGLLALAMVTVPVLVQWAQDLPGWVPLTLVGLLLLALGARLEAARRRGGQLRHWVAHLH